VKTIGFMIQDSHGKWLVSDHAGYYWDATARMGSVISAKMLKIAWETAETLSHGITSGLDIFEWRQGKVESIRTLKCAKFIYWYPDDGSGRATMMRISKVWGRSKPASVTGTNKSYWGLDLFGKTHKPVRVWKGEEQDILVAVMPTQEWYIKGVERHKRIVGSLQP
jgi:hypothetical protein